MKLNIKKTKIMASRPITSWQIHGEKVEAVTDFIFLSSKITVDNDFSHEIIRCLLLGGWGVVGETFDKYNVLESRDITLLTNVHLVKPVVFQ